MFQVFFIQKTALTGMHKVPPFCPSHFMVHKPLITTLWKQRQGNHKYKVTLDYRGSSRSAWGAQAPNSKEKRESTAQGHYLLLSHKGKTSKVLIAKAMKQTKNRSCQVTGQKDIRARPFRALWIHFPAIAKSQSCKPKPALWTLVILSGGSHTAQTQAGSGGSQGRQ